MGTTISIGEAVRRRRTDLGWTMEHLAHRCNLSVDTIGRIERCRAQPSFESLLKLSKGLGIPIPSLIGAIADDPFSGLTSQQREMLHGLRLEFLELNERSESVV